MNKHYIENTIGNILSLIVIVLYFGFIIRLAINWEFNEFLDFAAFFVIAAFCWGIAAAGIAGAQSAGKKRQLS